MCCRNETIWRRDHFSSNVERLKGGKQWKGSIREQTDIRDLQVLGQCCLQLLVKGTVVRNPLAVPNLAEHLIELVKVGQQRGCNSDQIFIHRYRQLEIKRGSPGLVDLANLWRVGNAGDTIAVVIISELPLYVMLRSGSIAHG